MIMAHLRNPGSFAFISGIDRFFLAPELGHYETGTFNDVWSLGTILYMLVTGGYGNKQNARAFEFFEDIWNQASPELVDFLKMCLIFDKANRASIDQILASDFMKMAAAGSIPEREAFPTRLSSGGFNLY